METEALFKFLPKVAQIRRDANMIIAIYFTKFLLFFLGISLAFRSVASIYRIIDLWYMIGKAYPDIVWGIIKWCGLSVIVVYFLGDFWRGAFIRGFRAVAVGYIIFYFLTVVGPIGAKRGIRKRQVLS